jgi:hypothetical protein
MGNFSLQRSPWKFFNLQMGPSDPCLLSSSSVSLASPLLPFCHRRPSPAPRPKLHLQPLYKPTRRLRVFHRSTSSPLSSSPRATSLPFLFRTASVTGHGHLLLIHRRALVAAPSRNATSLLTPSIPADPFQAAQASFACAPTAAAHLHCRRPLLHVELPLPTFLSLS